MIVSDAVLEMKASSRTFLRIQLPDSLILFILLTFSLSCRYLCSTIFILQSSQRLSLSFTQMPEMGTVIDLHRN
jgi:hypothetical protein